MDTKKDLKKAAMEMPLTKAFVAEKRAQWGDAHVKTMQRQAMAGVRGCFYAVERVGKDTYKVFGTPFDWDEADSALLDRCMLYGLDFAGLMRAPGGVAVGVQHGAA